jgi:ABC-type transport system substrate-binding protein
MDPQSMEWAAYQKKLKDREFEVCSLLWAMDGWENDFDQIWHSRGIQDPGSSNHIEFSNKEVDELSDRLRETIDPAKRTEMVRRIGRILYEEQPYCFFGWQNAFSVAWTYMKNVKEHPYKIRPFRRAYPIWDAR